MSVAPIPALTILMRAFGQSAVKPLCNNPTHDVSGMLAEQPAQHCLQLAVGQKSEPGTVLTRERLKRLNGKRLNGRRWVGVTSP